MTSKANTNNNARHLRIGFAGILMIMLVAIIPFETYAQTGTINGEVSVLNGGVLEGVAVVLQGTSHETTTDVDGRFTLRQVPEGDYTLVISYLGYVTIEKAISIGTGDNMDQFIELVADPLSVNETYIDFNQTQAFNKQRGSAEIKTVMSSEQLKRFGSYTIEDALVRFPGVQTTPYGGINIRGVGQGMYNVTVDGQQAASTGLGDRNIDIRSYSVGMFRDIEVIKVVTPDMNANALAGVVNLNTRSAEGVGRELEASLGGGANTRHFDQMGAVSSASLRYADSLKDEFSFAINLSHEQDNLGWESLGIDYDLADFGNGPVDVLGRVSPSLQTDQRHRLGGELQLSYQPSDRVSYYFRGLINEDNRGFTRHRNSYITGDPNAWTDEYATGSQGSFNYDVYLQETKIRQYQIQTGARHLFDSFDLDYNVGWSHGSHEQQQDETPFHLSNLDYTINWEDRSRPSFEITSIPLQHDGTIDPQRLAFQHYERIYDNHTDNNYTGRVNIEIPFALGSFKLGSSGQFTNKSGDFDDSRYTYLRNLTLNRFDLVRHGEFRVFDQDDYYIPRFVDPHSSREFYYGNKPTFNIDERRTQERSLILNYDASEVLFAGYGMGTVGFGNVELLLGTRVEYMNSTYDGRRVRFDDIGTLVEQTDTSQTKSNVHLFPNAQLKYSLGNQTNIRMAYSKTIARPDFNLLAPYEMSNLMNTTVYRGNPELDPMISNNMDLLFEHYFSDFGQFGIGLFYKELTGYIKQQQQTIEDGDFAGFTEYFHENSDESTALYGLEISLQKNLSFLPGFLSNFGTFANYTFTHSEFETEHRDENVVLPYQSPHILNVALNYTQGRLFTQALFYWADEALIGFNHIPGLVPSVGPDEVYRDLYQGGWSDLKLSARFRISDNFHLWANATNLLNSERVQYEHNRDYYTRSIDLRGGREFEIGIQYNL